MTHPTGDESFKARGDDNGKTVIIVKMKHSSKQYQDQSDPMMHKGKPAKGKADPAMKGKMMSKMAMMKKK